jgi:hypothetical protein
MSETEETDFQPSPESLQEARERFSRIGRSLFAQLQLAKTNADGGLGDVVNARVKLPGDEVLEVRIAAAEDRLRLEFDHLPAWVPASLSFFTAASVEQPLIRLGNLATPLEPAETDYSLAGDSKLRPPAETAHTLAADTSPDQGWQTDWADDGRGLQVRLEQAPGYKKVNIHCQLRSSSDLPPVVHYRVGWADKQGDVDLGEPGVIRFERGRNACWEGYASPGLDADQVREAPGFELRLSQEVDRSAEYLDAHEFLEVVGDDHQALILTPVTGAERPTFEAAFYSDEQRQLWLSPSASKMLRLQPV